MVASVHIDVKPDNYLNYTQYHPGDFSDQYIDFDASGWNVSLISSVKLAVATLYGGMGYAKTSFNMGISGDIPMPTANMTTGAVEYTDIGVVTEEMIDDVKVENFSGLRLNFGARLKLGVLTIHADYTRAHYNVVSAGLGISFR